MFLDGEDFKTVWQLAHNWVGADPNETDINAISLDLKTAIHRLMHVMACHEISVRSRRCRIFEDDSILSFALDFFHYLKFFQCLRKNKFNKSYLDNLFVKRNEVVNWCANVVFLDPPPCWAAKRISDSERIHIESEDTDEDNTGWYEKLTQLRRRKVICIGLAEQLWKKYPGLSYEEMHEYPAMKELGYSTKFQFKNFKKLVRPVASEPAKLGGRRTESRI